MPEPFETLIFVARLTRSEKDTIFAQAPSFPGSDLHTRVGRAVEDVCSDRLIRAQRCLEISRDLRDRAAASNDEELFRAAVGRAYYTVHHSVRVMVLWERKWDPDGHAESIEELKTLLKDNSFRGRSGLAADVWRRAEEARTNRNVEDYSPYNVLRDPPATTPVGITGQSWAMAAEFNIDVAQALFDAGYRIIGS